MCIHVFTACRFEKGGNDKGGIQAKPTLGGKAFSLSDVCGWFEHLLAALDCYNWVLEEQLVAPSEVFMCRSTQFVYVCVYIYTSFCNIVHADCTYCPCTLHCLQ